VRVAPRCEVLVRRSDVDRILTHLLPLVAMARAGIAAEPAGLPEAPFAVVELYTSEGCSSCPPADRILAGLAGAARRDGRRVFPLSFHVDYWDRLGWRDPFGDPAHARRQSRYAGAFASRYTPQMVVNGGESFVGSDAPRVTRSIEAALARSAPVAVRMRLEPIATDSVRVRWETSSSPRGAELHSAIVERSLTSDVERGENRGRTLQHENVVRLFRTITLNQSTSGRITLAIPAGVRPENASVIVFVQDTRRHTILGAAMADFPAGPR